jgi:hypothetical protein
LALTSEEEHRLRLFEKRVLRKILEPKVDYVILDWRGMHNVELHHLNFPRNFY